MKAKNLLVVVLATSLVMTSMVGCGKKEEEVPETTAGTTAVIESESAKQEVAETVTAAETKAAEVETTAAVKETTETPETEEETTVEDTEAASNEEPSVEETTAEEVTEAPAEETDAVVEPETDAPVIEGPAFEDRTSAVFSSDPATAAAALIKMLDSGEGAPEATTREERTPKYTFEELTKITDYIYNLDPTATVCEVSGVAYDSFMALDFIASAYDCQSVLAEDGSSVTITIEIDGQSKVYTMNFDIHEEGAAQ